MTSRITLVLVLLTSFCLPVAAIAQVKAAAPGKTAPKRVAPPRSGQFQRLPANPQLGTYLNKLSSRAFRNWYLPDGNNHVSISADVQPDGSSANLQAVSSPKNEAAEQAAMEAFNKLIPLDPLPTGVKSGKLTVNFDSKADPHGDSKSNITARFDPFPTAGKAAAANQAAPAANQAPPAANQAAPAANQAPPAANQVAPAANQAAPAANQAPPAANQAAPAANQAPPAANQAPPAANQAPPATPPAN